MPRKRHYLRRSRKTMLHTLYEEICRQQPSAAVVDNLLKTLNVDVCNYRLYGKSILAHAIADLSNTQRVEVARLVLAHPSAHNSKHKHIADFATDLLFGFLHNSRSCTDVETFLRLITHHPLKHRMNVNRHNTGYISWKTAIGVLVTKSFITESLLKSFDAVFPETDYTECNEYNGSALVVLTAYYDMFNNHNATEFVACLRFLLTRKHSITDRTKALAYSLSLETMPQQIKIDAIETLFQAGVEKSDAFVSQRIHHYFKYKAREGEIETYKLFLTLAMYDAIDTLPYPFEDWAKRTGPIEAACFLNRPEMLVKLLRDGTRPAAQVPTHQLFHKLRWGGVSWNISHNILRELTLPWAPKRHYLYNLTFRQIVVTLLLLLATQQQQQQQQLPWELWNIVFDFLCCNV